MHCALQESMKDIYLLAIGKAIDRSGQINIILTPLMECRARQSWSVSSVLCGGKIHPAAVERITVIGDRVHESGEICCFWCD